MIHHEMMIFSGNANLPLARSISHHLQIPLGKATVSKFNDGEIMIEILENVRGREVFVIQPTCAPTNDNLMELIILSDALRRASAARITAVVPYFGYARQDRRVRSARVPITAKVVADMMAAVGIQRVLTVDVHAEQIQGFFDMPVDNVYVTPVTFTDLRQQDYKDLVIVSPDVGGVVRARAIAKIYHDADLAIIDKRRPEPNKAEVMNLIGEVNNRFCVLVDDIIDTGGTLCAAAKVLKERGARVVKAYCTHPVLSNHALKNIENSAIDEVVVTDTIPLSLAAQQHKKIRQLNVGPLLADVICRINEERSVSSMFHEENK